MQLVLRQPSSVAGHNEKMYALRRHSGEPQQPAATGGVPGMENSYLELAAVKLQQPPVRKEQLPANNSCPDAS